MKGSDGMQKVLVVDNHPVMLELMTSLLEKEGHQVLTAVDGLSGLDILETYIPDVIFVNLIMPNISGEKLCRIIRSMPKLKDVYIIILSGVAAEEMTDFAELGANACIAKGPFDKMAKHVSSVLAQLDHGTSGALPGKIIGLEGMYQREISKELLSAKRHFELILSNMSEGILELTPESRIVYANPAAIFLFGLPEEKLLASNFLELFHETYHKMVKDTLEVIGDVPHTIGEGTPLVLNDRQISLSILQVKDNEHGTIIAILNDISERKRIENQLREAQKMEAINTLAGGIAHQFNNALSVITGNIELIKMGLPEDENVPEYIEPIKNSAHRMAHLTSQLLAYARGGRYYPEVVSLSAFMADTLPLIQYSIDPAIRIETDLPHDILHTEVDLTQMQMVLSAVVANANEAIEGQGRIRIIIRNEEIPGHHPHLKPGRYVCLSVEDDGKGMDKQTRSRIFDPFFTTNFLGRGLGMAAVYGIVENHGGWISVDSKLGKGTVARIYLPGVEVKEKEVEEAKNELERGTGTILVIEDEEMIRNVCRTMLERLGYRVLEATTGREAVNVAGTFDGDIDLAILDIGLPDMEGEKVYHLIKEARPSLKVIVCSGYAIDGPGQEIMDAGAQGFIQKPFVFGTLSAKLKEVLESK